MSSEAVTNITTDADDSHSAELFSAECGSERSGGAERKIFFPGAPDIGEIQGEQIK